MSDKTDAIARDFLDGAEDKIAVSDRFVAEKTDFGVIVRRPTASMWNATEGKLNDVTRSIITILVGRGYVREEMTIRERHDLWVKERP